MDSLGDHQPEHLGEEETMKKKMKRSTLENDEACSSRTRTVPRVAQRRVRFGMARRSVGERKTEALALGISFAALANLVIERKRAAGQNINVDGLALIYASAVKESLTNVYGHKLGSFATSFERSFNSTLNDSAFPHQLDNLEKSKLEMGVSKAAFRAERFKTELDDIRKADMLTRITDWLVVSVFNNLVSTLYGAYVFSQQRIMEATSICKPSSWWLPCQVSSINAEFNILWLRFWVQIYFAVLMILLVTFVIIRRSSSTKQTMPVTFTVLFIVYGLTGKFCVDTLGGNDKLWLFLWAMFCLLQFVAKIFTLALYGLMYGPINVTQGTKSSTMFPYWARRIFFSGVIMTLVLPVINGLLPFATFGEWRDHFSAVMYEFLGGFGL